MGASIAYQLTRKGVTDVTVVERTAIAASSGGKGGGFLAGGWGDGSVTQDLHRRSFELHEQVRGVCTGERDGRGAGAVRLR